MFGWKKRARIRKGHELEIINSITKLEIEARESKILAERYKKGLEDIREMTSFFWGMLKDVNTVATKTLEVENG